MYGCYDKKKKKKKKNVGLGGPCPRRIEKKNKSVCCNTC